MTRGEVPMPTEPLRASEAARRLDVPTKELLRLIHDREIRYVMVDGIAHVTQDAIDEYRSRASA
jgi:excisionase family DNA binding protein